MLLSSTTVLENHSHAQTEISSETPVAVDTAPATEQFNRLQAQARRYRDRGIAIARIKAGDKRPLYPKWQLSSIEPIALLPGDNIGILAGSLSGNLVCIDLDDANAVRLADEFLPETGMIEGRPGKPRSHRYYRVTNIPPEILQPADGCESGRKLGGPKTVQFRHPDKHMLLEVLGTGRHAAAPPSLHSSGEVRTWDQFEEPAEVDCRTLYDAAQRLAEECGFVSKKQPTASTRTGKAPTMGRPTVIGGDQGRCYHPGLPPMEERVQRARAYLDKMEPAISGQAGHDRTFHAACVIVRDFAVDPEYAWDLLGEYNQRCDPPWTEEELAHKLADADNFAGPRGYKLLDDLRESPTDPHRLARVFLTQDSAPDGGSRWTYWREEWFRWDDRRYVRIATPELRAKLTAVVRAELEAHHRQECQRLKEEHQESLTKGVEDAKKPKMPSLPAVTQQLVGNTIQALTSMTCISFRIEQPAWLKGDRTSEQRSYLALTNTLVDVEEYLAGRPEQRTHTASWFSPVCLPYAWNPTAQCPGWKAALDLIFNGDSERIDLIQEWFGYQLLHSTDLQKFMVLVGEGRNGKSVICAVLTAVLGQENVCHVPLESFGERFALMSTLGKLANVSAEIGELDKSAEGKLKAYTGGDRMTFDRKGIAPIEAVPTARLTFATNNPPRFSDRTNGLWRRLLLVPCDVVIPQGQRVLGMDKPDWWVQSGELPGILIWALEGLRRLRRQGEFTESSACKAALAQYRQDSNPAREFLLEHCGQCNAGEIACDELYQHYRDWCDQNGYRQPLANTQFGKEIVRVFPEVRRKKSGGRLDRKWVYAGVSTGGPVHNDQFRLAGLEPGLN